MRCNLKLRMQDKRSLLKTCVDASAESELRAIRAASSMRCSKHKHAPEQRKKGS